MHLRIILTRMVIASLKKLFHFIGTILSASPQKTSKYINKFRAGTTQKKISIDVHLWSTLQVKVWLIIFLSSSSFILVLAYPKTTKFWKISNIIKRFHDQIPKSDQFRKKSKMGRKQEKQKVIPQVENLHKKEQIMLEIFSSWQGLPKLQQQLYWV